MYEYNGLPCIYFNFFFSFALHLVYLCNFFPWLFYKLKEKRKITNDSFVYAESHKYTHFWQKTLTLKWKWHETKLVFKTSKCATAYTNCKYFQSYTFKCSGIWMGISIYCCFELHFTLTEWLAHFWRENFLMLSRKSDKFW